MQKRHVEAYRRPHARPIVEIVTNIHLIMMLTGMHKNVTIGLLKPGLHTVLAGKKTVAASASPRQARWPFITER